MRLLVLAAALAAFPAFADLYRWVDPDTGSVKFSTLPPPWLGDPAKERRAPPVELVPYRAPAAPLKPAPEKAQVPDKPAPSAALMADMEARWSSLLQYLVTVPAPGDAAGVAALKQQVESFQVLSIELDRLDPAGAPRRRAQEAAVAEAARKSAEAQRR